MELSDYRLTLVLQAVSKITQMMGRSGNELLINRGQYLHGGQLVAVPQLSSNSLRHAAVREPGGLWLIDQYELAGQLKKEMLRLLTNGGNNATLSGGAESLSRFTAMRHALPLLGLMGCGLPDGPKPGVLKMGDAVLVCDETREYVRTIAPELELPEWLRPARTCVGKWTNYRHDPVMRRPDLLDQSAGEEHDHSGMIFGGEAAVPGSLFVCEIHLESASVVEFGALIWSLRLWQAGGGYIGGMSAKGNGRTVAMIQAGDVDLEACADAYVSYAAEQRDAAWQWMQDVFAPPKKAERKGRKAKEEVPA